MERSFTFKDNLIKTSKYSILTFIPLNLYEQFQSLAKVYFLGIIILQFIPQISSVSPVTTGLPLCIVVILTGIKNAYNDWVSLLQMISVLWTRCCICSNITRQTSRSTTGRLWWCAEAR